MRQYQEAMQQHSNIAEMQHFGYMNPNGLPDNVTDLDLQNQLVDSIQDEDEELSGSSEQSVGQDLQMSNLRLSDIFNR
jgi:phage protein D